jgi:phosphoribosyl-ATP pyrophosphohydrolase
MFLEKLDRIIAERKQNPEEGSYTASLFKNGLDRILRKVGEESGEAIIAAKNQDKDELTNEAADLIFHLMVALHASGLSLQDVDRLLEQRHQK